MSFVDFRQEVFCYGYKSTCFMHESQYRAVLVDLKVVKTALPLGVTYALL